MKGDAERSAGDLREALRHAGREEDLAGGPVGERRAVRVQSDGSRSAGSSSPSSARQ